MHKKMIGMASCAAVVAALFFLFPMLFPHVEGQWVYQIDNLSGVHNVVIQENYAYATCNREGYLAGSSNQIAVLDITNPIYPRIIAFHIYTGFALGLSVVGNYAYLACNDSGLAIVDISNPTNDGVPVYCSLTGWALSVAVSGSYAYVACSDKHLAIIVVSNPLAPGAPVYCNLLDTVYDVAISGNRAYLTDGTAGLVIINVPDPANPGVPIYRNSTAMPIGARLVSIVQSRVYIGAQGLYMVDITDPANPGNLSVPGGMGDICGSHVALGPTRFLGSTNLFMACFGHVVVCNPSGGYLPNMYAIGIAFVAVVIMGIALMVGKERPSKSDAGSGSEIESMGDLRVA